MNLRVWWGIELLINTSPDKCKYVRTWLCSTALYVRGVSWWRLPCMLPQTFIDRSTVAFVSVYICIFLYLYIFIFLYLYICIFVYFLYLYIGTFVYLYIFVFVYLYICMLPQTVIDRSTVNFFISLADNHISNPILQFSSSPLILTTGLNIYWNSLM